LPIWQRARTYTDPITAEFSASPTSLPTFTTAILEGRQPSGLAATMLIEHPRLPLSWQQQRAALGFA
jgi:hypothetical protein